MSVALLFVHVEKENLEILMRCRSITTLRHLKYTRVSFPSNEGETSLEIILEEFKRLLSRRRTEQRCFTRLGKLGDLEQAEKVFHSMSKHNIVSYNILLHLYGLYRQSDRALKTYHQMCQQGHRPDDKTSVLLLHTLSQTTGRIADVKRIFSSIEENKRGPMLTAAMIAALVRAQLHDEATELLKRLSHESILFYAIKANIDGANDKFTYPTAITNEQLALYDLLMSNMYTYAGVHDRLALVDELIHDNSKLQSILGYSWFEKSNGRIEYVRNEHSPLKTCEHTEKLALDKALTEQNNTSLAILIGKNHRICTECHDYFKKVSLTCAHRRISLRDSTRFHIFSKGACSCEGSP